ncbi:MAG: hypothetical protein CVU89_04935 [Firmicutes bacterium HGW-Firmicutes-14]|nr:MAG: hypothetical protein CVU89_04935 [Firmicutes bacterium HGW-Firmicutes-14]
MELSSGSRPTSFRIKLFILLTVLGGLTVTVISSLQIESNIWGQVIIFAVLSFLAQLIPARLPQGATFSVAFIIDIILIGLYGTPVAAVTKFVVTFGAGLFSGILVQKDSLPRVLQFSSQSVLVVGLSGIVYYSIPQMVLTSILTSITYFLASTLFIALYSISITRESFKETWLSVIKTIYVNYFVLSSLSFVYIYMIENSSLELKIFSILVFFVPVILVSHAFRLATGMKQSYLKTVTTIAAAIEAKDSYMKGHSERVAELTVALAREFRMRENEIQKLEFAALLHDAGKIGIPDEILNKPGPLSVEEYDRVKEHSALGAEILQKIKFLQSYSDTILYHHEHYDGTGYPAGLRGDEIPLLSRFLAVADAYDAMTTDRPFRPAKTPEQTVEEMERLAGSQFDPDLVEPFKKILKKRGEI